MGKIRTVYTCQQCGGEHSKWGGRCQHCGAWNALHEEHQDDRTLGSFGFGKQARAEAKVAAENAPLRIGDIQAHAYKRIPIPLEELSRVLGGGIVPGSLILVGGDPGIGKSTLLAQVAGMLAASAGPVLYISGEESVYQIKMRIERLGVTAQELYLLSETNLEVAVQHIKNVRPKAVIIDSIQTVYLPSLPSSAGSVTQVRESSARLMQLAKAKDIPIMLVGHVTKEGAIAGPRVLEHIVDTVLYLEGDRLNTFRLLRAQKNRFGSTNEIGVFEMGEGGMIEVENPSAAFLSEHKAGINGSAVAVSLEGSRCLLIEIQSLVTPSSFSLPRRTTNGFDLNRLLVLLAVLSKRVGLVLEDQDVFVNVVGGLRLREPAADLAIAAAIASSAFEKAIPPELVLIGEIGLGGEIRSVPQIDKRVHEAAKLGFTRCIVPKAGRPPSAERGIKIYPVEHLRDALDLAFESIGETSASFGLRSPSSQTSEPSTSSGFQPAKPPRFPRPPHRAPSPPDEDSSEPSDFGWNHIPSSDEGADLGRDGGDDAPPSEDFEEYEIPRSHRPAARTFDPEPEPDPDPDPDARFGTPPTPDFGTQQDPDPDQEPDTSLRFEVEPPKAPSPLAPSSPSKPPSPRSPTSARKNGEKEAPAKRSVPAVRASPRKISTSSEAQTSEIKDADTKPRRKHFRLPTEDQGLDALAEKFLAEHFPDEAKRKKT